jgi:hypothetical protein
MLDYHIFQINKIILTIINWHFFASAAASVFIRIAYFSHRHLNTKPTYIFNPFSRGNLFIIIVAISFVIPVLSALIVA